MGSILMTLGLVASLGYATMSGAIEPNPDTTDEPPVGGTPTTGEPEDDRQQPTLPPADGGWQTRPGR